MSPSQLLTLIATTIGFVSSCCFAYGSFRITAADVVEQTTRTWRPNEAEAKSIISQSAQYQVGSLLLVAYFLLSIAATQASAASLQWQYLAQVSSWHIVFATLVPSGVVAALAICVLERSRAVAVQKLRQK